MYSPTSRSILLVMDYAALVEFETKWTMQWEAVHSHKFPVTACKYNATFGHLVTASANSVIKVWDFDSGKFLYAFDGGSGNMAITSICFDLAGRRLLTAGQDGIIRIWNYHSGACLRELCPGEINDRNCEISSLQCVRIGFNRFIVSVGWDRHINLYADVIEDRGALKESIGQIQRPIPHWGHDLTIGHAEDIQALAVGSSGFLATADFAGEILVWNTVSGHIFKRLSVISSTERTSSVTSISGTSMSRSRNTAWGPRGTSKSCLLSEGSEHSRSATFTSIANSGKTTETASSTQVSSASPKRRLEGAALGGEWNLRTQPKRVNHGGPNDYQTLKIFEFTTSPEITELKFSTPEQELADQLAAKLDEPLPPLKPSISQRIFAIN
nr:unnamed protein product [Spirometra erinaceieuropaei]